MSRKTRTITALCLILCLLFTGCTKDEKKVTEQPTETPTPTLELSPTPTPEPESEVEHMTLKDRYKDVFKVGVALNNTTLKNKDYMDIVKEPSSASTATIQSLISKVCRVSQPLLRTSAPSLTNSDTVSIARRVSPPRGSREKKPQNVKESPNYV